MLQANPEASAKAVNDAWKAAGKKGTISESLVVKSRAALRKSGNRSVRPGPKPATAKAPKAQSSNAPALVLHGGSGTQPDYIRRAVSLGMAKINVASELCKAFREVYAQQHSNGKSGWLPTVLGATKPEMAKVMARWFELSGAAGKA